MLTRQLLIKPGKIAFSLFLFLFYGGQSLFAQTVFGPFDTYVSKQAANPFTLFSGSVPATADEGRVINIQISNITGPITVNPQTYSLNGPPCPTYDAHGRRTPANPAPNTSATFTGSITIPVASIPAPGTSTAASFRVKEDGYWTRCSQNQQVPYPQTVTVQFNIKSLNLVMSSHNAAVCEGNTADVTIAQRFPASGGTISYASVNGKVSVADIGNGFRMTYVASGDDAVVATYTMGGATFRDTVKVKVGKLKFAQARYNYLCPVNGNIDLKSLLAAGSIQTNLQFKGSLNGAAEANLAQTINKNAYRPGDRLTVKVKSTDNATCEATTLIRFYGLDINIPNNTACDGATLPFSADITPRHNTIKNALLATVAGLTPTYTLAVASRGNPRGNTNLTFAAFDANYNSRVQNMIWYANIASECNNISTYNLRVGGTIGGQAIQSPARPINADVNGGTCCNGSAGPTQSFVGVPVFNVVAVPGGFNGFVQNWAPFVRNMRATTTIMCQPNSQWRALITAEENYHVGQITGVNGVLGALQFIRANVVNAVNGAGPYFAPNAIMARNRCIMAFIAARNAENARSLAMYAYPGAHRCRMERQAKVAVRMVYRFKMSCAYPACP